MIYCNNKINKINLLAYNTPQRQISEIRIKDHRIVAENIIDCVRISIYQKFGDQMISRNNTYSPFSKDFIQTLNSLIPINQYLDELIYELL